jgi:hypothetical protein
MLGNDLDRVAMTDKVKSGTAAQQSEENKSGPEFSGPPNLTCQDVLSF